MFLDVLLSSSQFNPGKFLFCKTCISRDAFGHFYHRGHALHAEIRTPQRKPPNFFDRYPLGVGVQGFQRGGVDDYSAHYAPENP